MAWEAGGRWVPGLDTSGGVGQRSCHDGSVTSDEPNDFVTTEVTPVEVIEARTVRQHCLNHFEGSPERVGCPPDSIDSHSSTPPASRGFGLPETIAGRIPGDRQRDARRGNPTARLGRPRSLRIDTPAPRNAVDRILDIPVALCGSGMGTSALDGSDRGAIAGLLRGRGAGTSATRTRRSAPGDL